MRRREFISLRGGSMAARGNSPYFTGHDAPHLGQTLGLNAVGNLLGIVGVALVDRRYDLFLTRRLELIPDCLEVGRHLGVGAGHAGKHGIKIIAMEVTRESHLEEIHKALTVSGFPTGVMLQIGTRNAQNFELLKAVGAQTDLPVLFKRGMGITLEESLNACEYVASGGNRRIVFCLRGMKTNLGDPHRNFVDFGHVPVVKRLTRLPVCVDPSHSVGRRTAGPDGILDVFHVTAQGVIAGANLVLVDVHPRPEEALCDGPQALLLQELPHFLDDVAIARRAYEERLARAARA